LPTASTITIPETLGLLDGDFRGMAEGIAENRYALWLGSGISFGRVDGLSKVVPRVVEHLRSRVFSQDATCQYWTALQSALALTAPTTEERARFDYSQPFSSWADAESLTKRLINQYSRLLQIRVGNEPSDYLLWDAIDIARTFADPNTEPDVEHLCIAILVLEGLTSDIASANWDGLIEKATNSLADNATSLVVCIRPEELQQQPGKALLLKFHGCAVKAAADQPKYRPFLTGRLSQINRWVQDYPAMTNRLVALISSKPSLMIGLSAQDSNIQGIFAEAESSVQWPWPGERPSLVFSASELGVDQSALLENVYRDAYNGVDRDAIDRSATFPAYGKPLLISLVLHSLAAKLSALIDLGSSASFGAVEKAKLRSGIQVLRDRFGQEADADPLSFVNNLIQQSGRLMGMFQTGQVPGLPNRYLPVTSSPVQTLAGDHLIEGSGLPEAAVAAGILGALLEDGKIHLKAADPTKFGSGAFNVESPLAPGKIFFAANANAALRLWNNGLVRDEGDTILVHSLEVVPSQTRSPRSSPGRTGRSGLREVSIAMLAAEVSSIDELVLRFRQEVGL
jgi:SIR2-like domain